MTEPRLLRLDSADSTQDRVHELAEAGAPPGTAVVAAEQTSGRGARGRSWSAPRGGLWLSVLARPGSADGIELASLRAGLAVAYGIEAVARELRVELKWPNDLIVNDRKAGGILCEARWQGELPAWAVIGVGVNVTNPVPAEARYGATRLAEHAPRVEIESLIPAVLGRLRRIDWSLPRLTDGEFAAFAGRDWLRGRSLREPVGGVADGIDRAGSLRVRAPDGRLALVRVGTVVLESAVPRLSA